MACCFGAAGRVLSATGDGGGEARREPRGYEKLIDGVGLLGRPSRTASDVLTVDGSPCAAGPNHEPSPSFTFWLATLKVCICKGAPRGFSLLPLVGPGDGTSSGMVGTGGTSTGRAGGFRCGDGLRKVRSVMDPVLPLRCSPGRRPSLVVELTLALRRWVRFVCTAATLVGVMGRALSAAAAAAAESDIDVLGVLWRMKAEAAAVAALRLAVAAVSGCKKREDVSACLGQVLLGM